MAFLGPLYGGGFWVAFRQLAVVSRVPLPAAAAARPPAAPAATQLCAQQGLPPASSSLLVRILLGTRSAGNFSSSAWGCYSTLASMLALWFRLASAVAC